MPYRKKKRYSRKRKSYAKKYKGFYGMRRRGTVSKYGSTVHKDTRRVTVKRLPSIFPDRCYTNMTYTQILPIESPTQATTQPPYTSQRSISINRLSNIFNAVAADAGGDETLAWNVHQWDTWRRIYSVYRVEAITFKITAMLKGGADEIGQLILIPRDAAADKNLPVTPGEGDTSALSSRQMARSVISGPINHNAQRTLVYQTSIPVLTGEPMGENPDFDANFVTSGDGSSPATHYVMDMYLFNVFSDTGMNPPKIQYDLTYHVRLDSRMESGASSFYIPPLPGPGVGMHQRYRGAPRHSRTSAASRVSAVSEDVLEDADMMSEAGSTVSSSVTSGFTKLMRRGR